MELDGTEQRIRALFSELSLEDRSRVPRYEKLWTVTTNPSPVFRRLVAATAAIVVIVALSSFVLWSRQSQTVRNIAPVALPAPATPQLASIVVTGRPQAPRQKRMVRRRHAGSVSISEAALLARWQSPTQNFMRSPISVSFNSLPQLNQSMKELESFLPKEELNQ